MKKRAFILSLFFISWFTCGGLASSKDFQTPINIPNGFSVEIGISNCSMDMVLGKTFYEGKVLATGFQFKVPRGLFKGLFLKVGNNFSIDGGRNGSPQGKGLHFKTNYEVGIERFINSVLIYTSFHKTSLWEGKFYGIRFGMEAGGKTKLRPFVFLEMMLPSGNGEIIAGDDLYAKPWLVKKCILYCTGIKGNLNISNVLNQFSVSAIGHTCGALGYKHELVSALQGEFKTYIFTLKSNGKSKKKYVTISPRIFGQISLSSNSLAKSFLGCEMRVSLEVPIIK